MLVDRYTGEVVDSLDEKHIRAVIDRCSADIDKHYRDIEDIQNYRSLFEAELPPADFPPPRRRSRRQEAVARCPKCGLRYGLTPAPIDGKIVETNEGE